MKLKTIATFLACVCASLARADFNPVELTPDSYTFDIVVESNTAAALPYCINASAGSGTNLQGDFTYYEQGLYARLGQPGGNSGIPLHNTIFTNISNANISFLMPPDYTTNNELMVDSTFTSGTLVFNTATTATNLAVLCTGGGGNVTVGYTVTHRTHQRKLEPLLLTTGSTPVPSTHGVPTVASITTADTVTSTAVR